MDTTLRETPIAAVRAGEYSFTSRESDALAKFAAKESNRDYYRIAQWTDKEFSSEFEGIISVELAEVLKRMALGDGPEVLVIRNFPVDEPLPLYPDLAQNVREKGRNSEAILTGMAAVMGGVLQREESSHQDGYVQQIYPVTNFSAESSGRGMAPLPFHVENVFIKKAPSFLALACLAGQKGVKTEYLPVEDVVKHLSREDIAILSQPKFRVSSGDGFAPRTLSETPVFDALPNGWMMSRIYEEDRIHSDCPSCVAAISALKDAIKSAKADSVKEIELDAGTILLFSNGVAKGRLGGVLHGRKGQISEVDNLAQDSSQRWLQRVCIEIPYS